MKIMTGEKLNLKASAEAINESNNAASANENEIM
jgi:hypothetical protein